MKLVIDNLTETTGWTVNAPSTVSQISFSEWLAGHNSSSLMFFFDDDDTTRTATKTYSVDVSDYDELVFHIHSFKYKQNRYRYNTDFNYKITLNGTEVFYVPMYTTWNDVTIDISGINTLTEIKLEPLHDTNDYVVWSYIVAVKEEISIDMMEGLKDLIENEQSERSLQRVQIGTVSVSNGDTAFTINNHTENIERYTVIQIDDTVNSEIHLITGTDSYNGITEMDLNNFDGNTIQNDFTNAPIYVYYPVTINNQEREIYIPGITIWGVSPEAFATQSEIDSRVDSWQPSAVSERGVGQQFRYNFLIDCEARDYMHLQKCHEVVRKAIAKKIVWIDGKRFRMDFVGPATEIEPTEAVDIIPKIQYNVAIEITEELFDRLALPYYQTTIINTNLVEQGEI